MPFSDLFCMSGKKSRMNGQLDFLKVQNRLSPFYDHSSSTLKSGAFSDIIMYKENYERVSFLMLLSDLFSSFLVRVLVKNHTIEKDVSEIYKYCFDYIFGLIFFFLILQTVSIFLSVPAFAPLFFTIIMPFRSVCGGFHASTRLQCALLSYGCFIITYIIYLLTWSLPDLYWLISFFIVTDTLYVFPAVTHKNRNFSHSQKKRMRKFRHILCVMWSVLFCIAYLLRLNLYFHLMAICVTIVLLNLLIAVFITRRTGGYSIDF